MINALMKQVCLLGFFACLFRLGGWFGFVVCSVCVFYNESYSLPLSLSQIAGTRPGAPFGFWLPRGLVRSCCCAASENGGKRSNRQEHRAMPARRRKRVLIVNASARHKGPTSCGSAKAFIPFTFIPYEHPLFPSSTSYGYALLRHSEP